MQMKGFKTLAVSGALVLLGAADQLGLVDLVPDQYKGLVIAVIGAIMAGLRVITTSPVLGRK
jgi:hypothetical protein